ncbi:hypothetical protein OUZ56_030118 [Daphnia magna]|uniref:Uncharacterized protein n=1 Tax=Daphnia magna TaxID=35525 RepID=A0ABQ9ZQR8_9CRUS|nr:hypothetical protein OUZ56_030118 [Daphnia magna]
MTIQHRGHRPSSDFAFINTQRDLSVSSQIDRLHDPAIVSDDERFCLNGFLAANEMKRNID